jgi:hypothetical protein
MLMRRVAPQAKVLEAEAPPEETHPGEAATQPEAWWTNLAAEHQTRAAR